MTGNWDLPPASSRRQLPPEVADEVTRRGSGALMRGRAAFERREELVAQGIHPGRAGVGDVFGHDEDLDGAAADRGTFISGAFERVDAADLDLVVTAAGGVDAEVGEDVLGRRQVLDAQPLVAGALTAAIDLLGVCCAPVVLGGEFGLGALRAFVPPLGSLASRNAEKMGRMRMDVGEPVRIEGVV